MVRIKHRYLLVEILSPQHLPIPNTNTQPTTNPSQPHHLLPLHAPTPDTITSATLLSLLRSTLHHLHGDHGAAIAGAALQIKYWSNATSTFIVRCKREVVALVWGAVTWVCEIEGKGKGMVGEVGKGKGGEMWKGRVGGILGKEGEGPRKVVMRVVRVSGTVRKCEEEAVRRARALCGRVRGVEEAVKGGLALGVGGGRGAVGEGDVFGEGEVGGERSVGVSEEEEEEEEVDEMDIG